MRPIKTVLILMVIALGAALLATGTTDADTRGRGGGSQYRGGGGHSGGGNYYRGGGGHYSGGNYYRGGNYYGGGRYYRGGHYYGGRYYRGGPYYRGWGYYRGGPYYRGWGRPWRYNYPYYYPYFSLGFYPYYYPYSYPYYAPSYYSDSPEVVAPSTPQVYIEREQEGSGPAETPSGVWYYCPDSKGYYPYVNKCPGGWQTVPAEPPAEPGR